jgi:hypothetical protein
MELIFALDQAMNNLALSYSALGRHDEALAIRESVLKYRQQKPENLHSLGTFFNC